MSLWTSLAVSFEHLVLLCTFVFSVSICTGVGAWGAFILLQSWTDADLALCRFLEHGCVHFWRCPCANLQLSIVPGTWQPCGKSTQLPRNAKSLQTQNVDINRLSRTSSAAKREHCQAAEFLPSWDPGRFLEDVGAFLWNFLIKVGRVHDPRAISSLLKWWCFFFFERDFTITAGRPTKAPKSTTDHKDPQALHSSTVSSLGCPF